MIQTKEQQIQNLSTEYKKLLYFLYDKFPKVYEEYKSKMVLTSTGENYFKK